MRTVAAALATVFCLLPMLLSSGGWGVQAEYDPVSALRSVYYCKVSKCPPPNISSWNCGESCTNFSGAVSDVTAIWSDSDQTQMFIAYNSVYNEIAIAFRGSTTLLNWLEDAEAWMTDYPWCTGCQVHTGFQTTYNQIAPNITAAVTALLAKYPSATIFLAGHSLGAAQARLCALDMQRRFGSTNRVVTYTIGTPRFANKALSAWAEAQLSRGEHYYITHDADPVPHLPPESWGYIHVPQEVWYKTGIDAQGYKVCNGTVDREDPTCADSLPLPINIEDHLVYLGVSTGCGADGDAMEKRELLRLVKAHVKEVADRSKQHANGRAHRRDAVARRLRLPKH